MAETNLYKEKSGIEIFKKEASDSWHGNRLEDAVLAYRLKAESRIDSHEKNAEVQVLIALVNVRRLPNGSFTDMSRVPHGVSSKLGRAYVNCLALSSACSSSMPSTSIRMADPGQQSP